MFRSPSWMYCSSSDFFPSLFKHPVFKYVELEWVVSVRCRFSTSIASLMIVVFVEHLFEMHSWIYEYDRLLSNSWFLHLQAIQSFIEHSFIHLLIEQTHSFIHSLTSNTLLPSYSFVSRIASSFLVSAAKRRIPSLSKSVAIVSSTPHPASPSLPFSIQRNMLSSTSK